MSLMLSGATMYSMQNSPAEQAIAAEFDERKPEHKIALFKGAAIRGYLPTVAIGYQKLEETLGKEELDKVASEAFHLTHKMCQDEQKKREIESLLVEKGANPNFVPQRKMAYGDYAFPYHRPCHQ